MWKLLSGQKSNQTLTNTFLFEFSFYANNSWNKWLMFRFKLRNMYKNCLALHMMIEYKMWNVHVYLLYVKTTTTTQETYYGFEYKQQQHQQLLLQPCNLSPSHGELPGSLTGTNNQIVMSSHPTVSQSHSNSSTGINWQVSIYNIGFHDTKKHSKKHETNSKSFYVIPNKILLWHSQLCRATCNTFTP